jgi:hypothetical protein
MYIHVSVQILSMSKDCPEGLVAATRQAEVKLSRQVKDKQENTPQPQPTVANAQQAQQRTQWAVDKSCSTPYTVKPSAGRKYN